MFLEVLFIISYPDVVSRDAEGVPRDVEPPVAGEELVGEFVSLEEGNEALELLRILGADVGGLAEQVLRVTDSTHEGVDARVAETGVDEDGTDCLSGGFQEHQTAVGHVRHVLHGGLVLCIGRATRGRAIGVFARVDEFFQRKVRR